MKQFVVQNFHFLPITLLIIHVIRTVAISATVADALIIFSLAALTGFFMWIQSKAVPEKELPPEIKEAQLRIAKMRMERDLAVASADLLKVSKSIGVESEIERKHRF